MSDLLNDFLLQDCDEHVRSKLLDEISKHVVSHGNVVRELTFKQVQCAARF